MELKWLKVKGFKRFNELSKLDLSGRLVALVGPNEAVKSSILKAITYIGSDQKIPDIDSTRGSDTTNIEISSEFLLDEEDLKKAELSVPTWLIIKKLNNSSRLYELNPRPPLRNIESRKEISSKIHRVISNKKVITELEFNISPSILALVRGLLLIEYMTQVVIAYPGLKCRLRHIKVKQPVQFVPIWVIWLVHHS